MRYSAWITAAALAVVLAPSVDAQRKRDKGRDRDRDDEEYVTRIDTTFAFDRDGTVALSAMSGDIVVTSWNRPEVKVRAHSERGQILFEASRSRVDMSVRTRGRSGDTRYEVTVPEGARVLTQSISGEISLRGIRGESTAHTVSGDVDIADMGSRLEVTTVSGSARIVGVDGKVEAEAVSGDLELERIRGDVDASTVSGEITIDGARSKYVHASSHSGSVSFSGAIDPSGRYELGTHSGNLQLMLPASAAATLDLETFSGEIESDFQMILEPGNQNRGRRQMAFKIGKGGARISAQTHSGNIT
ncbi:MAG: DUF4097 family beta strand repeat-containing protein, partial [Gemmatimonadaceae bacterium]